MAPSCPSKSPVQDRAVAEIKLPHAGAYDTLLGRGDAATARQSSTRTGFKLDWGLIPGWTKVSHVIGLPA